MCSEEETILLLDNIVSTFQESLENSDFKAVTSAEQQTLWLQVIIMG